jgi:polyisoprenoid-binding protein YceI
MRFELSPDSRVFIDLRAAGLLRAVGHDPTLAARPEPASIDLDDGQLVLRFAVADIEAPGEMTEPDRRKLLANLRGAEVLDADRFPAIELRARYEGTVDGGELRGDLVVRGQPRRVAMSLRTTRQWDVLVASGSWEGSLGDLGIKPFKALLGALRLKDWIRLRVEARLWTPSTA